MPCTGTYIGGCCDESVCPPDKITVLSLITATGSAGSSPDPDLMFAGIDGRASDFFEAKELADGLFSSYNVIGSYNAANGVYSYTPSVIESTGGMTCNDTVNLSRYANAGSYIGNGRSYGIVTFFMKARIYCPAQFCVKESESIIALPFEKTAADPFPFPTIDAPYQRYEPGTYDLVATGSPDFNIDNRVFVSSNVGGGIFASMMIGSVTC